MITLNQLIEKLLKLKEEHGGDMKITSWPYDGQTNTCDIQDITVADVVFKFSAGSNQGEWIKVDPYVIIEA